MRKFARTATRVCALALSIASFGASATILDLNQMLKGTPAAPCVRSDSAATDSCGKVANDPAAGSGDPSARQREIELITPNGSKFRIAPPVDTSGEPQSTRNEKPATAGAAPFLGGSPALNDALGGSAK